MTKTTVMIGEEGDKKPLDYHILNFDVRGTNPNNRIEGEKIFLDDKTCPWVIPDGSPFFADLNFLLYDKNGMELKRNRDYFLEESATPLTAMSGKRVMCFVRLTQAVRDNNDFITIDYQSIGAYFVPRNELSQWLEEIKKGKIPVPWEKVFGKPDTYPPEWHIHDISNYEIGDWFELSWFFEILKGIRETRDDTANQTIDDLVSDTYARLYETRDTQTKRIIDHGKNYAVPHDTKKADIGLGNHDNFHTATAAEDAAGTSSTLFSTPNGVIKAVKAYVPDDKDLMRNGTMPISIFGGSGYLPPTIAGSFEGIGTDQESNGFCLENDGRLVMIQKHFDGRSEALYYSVIENYKQSITPLFTGYKYQPASLGGVAPDEIVTGSNSKVIMVGQYNTPNWYVALSNGTFNPSVHKYVKVDMTTVNTDMGHADNYYRGAWQATVHHMGDWIYLVQCVGKTDYGSNGDQYFYRVSVADIKAGKAVKFNRVNLTYVDYEGVSRSNMTYFRMTTIVKDTSGRCTRFGFDLTPYSTNNGAWYRRFLVHSAPKDGGALWGIRFRGKTYQSYNVPGAVNSADYCIEMCYDFNPNTGVFTLLQKTPKGSANFVTQTSAQISTNLSYANYYVGQLNFNTTSPASVILNNGDVIGRYGKDSGNQFPVDVLCIYTNTSNAYATVSKLLTPDIISNAQSTTGFIEGPLSNNTFTFGHGYEKANEWYTANRNIANGGRRYYYKVITGDYAYRDEVTNVQYDVNARPLTNKIYESLVTTTAGHIKITGTAAELTTSGSVMGDWSWSFLIYFSNNVMAGQSSEWNQHIDNSSYYTIPRTVGKTLDNSNMTVSLPAQTYYAFTKQTLDTFFNILPSDVRGNTYQKGLSLAVVNGAIGGLFNGMDFLVVGVQGFRPDQSQQILAVGTYRVTWEAPNSTHPNCYLAKGITLISSANGVSLSNVLDLPDYNLKVVTNTEGPRLDIYKNGTTLDCYFSTGVGTRVVGNDNYCAANFKINTSSLSVTEYEPFNQNWAYSSTQIHMVPNVGRCDCVDYRSNSGSAALVVKSQANSLYYLLASVYPDPLWVLYFKEGTTVVFNGTKYAMPTGSIDLRDIDPNPQNKTYYLYATIQGSTPKYILTVEKQRHNLFMVPAGTIVTSDKQIFSISTRQPFMLGDYIQSQARDGGTYPASSGVPMEEGSLNYVYSTDLQ